MMKGWNHAGGKVLARYKTGTSRQKLRVVRQHIVRYQNAYETFYWAGKWRFIYSYLPAHIIPTLNHYGHELNSQIFLTIYFCWRFFLRQEILHQHLLRHKILHIYFGMCCFFAISNKCTNICDTNKCNAKNFDVKNDVARINWQTFLWIYFCNNNFCIQNFCAKNLCVTVFVYLFLQPYILRDILLYI